MSRSAAPPPPPSLANLKRLASTGSIPEGNAAAPAVPESNRPSHRQQPRPLSTETARTSAGPPLPPPRPRTMSVESKTMGPPQPPPQRTKPSFIRQDARRESGPPPLPTRNVDSHVTVGQGQGRAASVDQGQCQRVPPPLPPRDRAVSLDSPERPNNMKLIRDRINSEPSSSGLQGPRPHLQSRPLPVIPAASPIPTRNTGRTDNVNNVANDMSEKSGSSLFEEQFIFTSISELPAPEAFQKVTRVYPSKAVMERKSIPP